MNRLSHLYHHTKRITHTLVLPNLSQTMIVNEQFLFDMAKKAAMEREQDRLVRDMMERIDFIPMPKVDFTRRVMYD